MKRDIRTELVRVDAHGQAHPIGSVASQRLRARTGTYRLLPSPQHVVFLRYTGEDGRRDEADGRIIRLAGEITAPSMLCDIMALIGQAGWRGELVVLEGDDVRSIFFEQGNVVGAVTNVLEERIGSVLYRFGAIDEQERDRVLAATSGGKRFGEAALDLGLVTRERLYQFIAKQVQEIVFAALAVGDGTFFFLEGFADERLVVRHTASASGLLMDGVRRMDEMRFFREKIPSAEHVPIRTDRRGAPEECAAVYEAVDGKSSVEEIGRVTGLGEFETTKQLYTLVQSQHVAIHLPRVSGGPTAIVEAANGALRILFAAAKSGRREEEVRSSLASFAVGAGVYEMLFRGAGPAKDGSFVPQAVADNSVLVAGGADPTQVLKQMLHEYVSFALFSAGAALGVAVEAELVRQVRPMLSVLKPQG
ncbi:MAG TPA: DUF4388 domain-containing protein [Polyangiaceae bacterium]